MGMNRWCAVASRSNSCNGSPLIARVYHHSRRTSRAAGSTTECLQVRASFTRDCRVYVTQTTASVKYIQIEFFISNKNTMPDATQRVAPWLPLMEFYNYPVAFTPDIVCLGVYVIVCDIH